MREQISGSVEVGCQRRVLIEHLDAVFTGIRRALETHELSRELDGSAVGATEPDRIFTSLLSPAPLSPISETISPGYTVKPAPHTTDTCP